MFLRSLTAQLQLRLQSFTSITAVDEHQDHDPNVPKGPWVWVLFDFLSILSGSGSQIVMVHTLMLVASAGQDHDSNVHMGPSHFLNFRSSLLGSGPQMHMMPTLVLAQWAGQNDDPNVPMGVRVLTLLEFLFYLIRKWSPDGQCAHGHVGGVGGPDHDHNVPKDVRVQVLFELLLYLIKKWFPDGHGAHPDVGGVGGSGP